MPLIDTTTGFFCLSFLMACHIFSEAKAEPPGELMRNTTAFTSSSSISPSMSLQKSSPTIWSAEANIVVGSAKSTMVPLA